MVTKILAGVLAAVAVTTAGIYYAYPGSSECPLSRVTSDSQAGTEKSCCSSRLAKPVPTAATVEHSCCMLPPANIPVSTTSPTQSESVAAFAGSVALAVK